MTGKNGRMVTVCQENVPYGARWLQLKLQPLSTSIDRTTHITVSHTIQIRSSDVRCSCVRSEKQLKRRDCPGPRVHRLGQPWTP